MVVNEEINDNMIKSDDSNPKEPSTLTVSAAGANESEITMKQGTNISDTNTPMNNFVNEMKDGSRNPSQNEEIQSIEEPITENTNGDIGPVSCQPINVSLPIQKNPSDDMCNDVVNDNFSSEETNPHPKTLSSDESLELNIIKESLAASQKFLSTNTFLIQQQRLLRTQKEEDCEEKKSDLVVNTDESIFTGNSVWNSNKDESPKDVITAFPIVKSDYTSKSDIKNNGTTSKESTMIDLESNMQPENSKEDYDPKKTDENIIESSTLQLRKTKQNEKKQNFKKINRKKLRTIMALIVIALGLGFVIFGVLHVLMKKDSQIVTHSNSKTEQEATSIVPTKDSSSTPSSFPTQIPFQGYPELSFFVMGDIPYNSYQRTLLQQQLNDIRLLQLSGKDSSQFIIHVGDFMSSNSGCTESDYEAIHQTFTEKSPIPILTVPGDNEWNDCPNPNKAWERFDKHFIGIEKQWRDNTFHSIVERSTKRSENFVFFKYGILFLGINMVAGNESHSDSRQRLIDNEQWLKLSIEKYSSESRAIFIFAHSTLGSSIFSTIKDVVKPLKIPMVYINGNVHYYRLSRQFDHTNAPEMSDKFWRVQLDAGAFAPPMKISIEGTLNESLSKEFEKLSDHQTLIADGLIKLDRIEKISYFSRWA